MCHMVLFVFRMCFVRLTKTEIQGQISAVSLGSQKHSSMVKVKEVGVGGRGVIGGES